MSTPSFYQQSPQRSFEEINLPFDTISEDQDYISGEELYDALNSREVRNSMEEYNVSTSRYNDGGFEFNASKSSYLGLGKTSQIAFEGEIETMQDQERVEAKHYHMRLEVVASDQEEMDVLEQDLGRLEKGLRDYYENNKPEIQVGGKQLSFSD
jgi:hypothetical protein